MVLVSPWELPSPPHSIPPWPARSKAAWPTPLRLATRTPMPAPCRLPARPPSCPWLRRTWTTDVRGTPTGAPASASSHPARASFPPAIASVTASQVLTGTSMATPHVSGVLALWAAAHNVSTVAQLKQMIQGAASKAIQRDSLVSQTPNLLLFNHHDI